MGKAVLLRFSNERGMGEGWGRQVRACERRKELRDAE